MGRRRWQKKAHTNWACRFARSDEQGGLGQIHVDSGRTHRPRTCRGWPDPQAAAGPRGPAKSRRRANWLPAGRHPPGPMPPAPGVEPAPARGYALPWAGWPRAPPAVEGRMSLRVVQFASNPAPPTSACFAALALPIHRRAEARGGRPGWLGGWLGGSARGGPEIYNDTPAPHPPPSGLTTHLPCQHDSSSMAHSRERRKPRAGERHAPPGTPPSRGRTAPVTPGESGFPSAWRVRVPGQSLHQAPGPPPPKG